MAGKIIPLGNITKLDLPIDRVLEAAKRELKSVLLLGYDKDGKFYFASTMADGGDVLWLLENCKKRLLEVADEIEP